MTDIVETIEYKGFNINIMRDDDAMNPIENDHGTWNMLSRYNSTITVHGSDAIHDPLQYFTDGQIIHHSKRICDAFGTHISDVFGVNNILLSDALAEHMNDYRDEHYTAADCKREFFQECLDNTPDSDLFDTLAALYDIIKIPNLNTCSTGYSQGDYVDIFIVALPDQVEKFGLTDKSATYDFQRDMTAQAAIYGAYLWGDCYGYQVTDSDGNDIDDGSCWGFYTDNHETSGLLEQARNAIDCEVAHLEKLESMLTNVQICKGLGL